MLRLLPRADNALPWLGVSGHRKCEGEAELLKANPQRSGLKQPPVNASIVVTVSPGMRTFPRSAWQEGHRKSLMGFTFEGRRFSQARAAMHTPIFGML